MGHRAWTAEATEQHISHYDNENVWRVVAYDNKSADILQALGAVEVKDAGAGATFDCTALQMINYIARLHGITIETGQKKRHLSEEAKERKRQQLATARSKIRA